MKIMDEEIAVIGIGCNFPGGKNDTLSSHIGSAHGALLSAYSFSRATSLQRT